MTVRRFCAVVSSNGELKSILAIMIRDHMGTLYSSMTEKTDRHLHQLRKKTDRLASSNMVSMISFFPTSGEVLSVSSLTIHSTSSVIKMNTFRKQL